MIIGRYIFLNILDQSRNEEVNANKNIFIIVIRDET